MKNLATAIIIGLMLAGVTLAQSRRMPQAQPQRAEKSTKPRIAVLEFRSSTSVALPYWDWDTGAQAQQQLIKELEATGKFVVSPRDATRTAVSKEALTLTGPGAAESAVKIGKLLGVNYVLISEVSEPRAGIFALKARLVEISSKGRPVIRIDFADESDTSGLTKQGTGTLILSQTNTYVGPVIQKLTASLKAADL